ncbi:MAG: hypothetical protein JNL63_02680 [Bacteroidia bacterium]|nr:hypothetical protein [Bacteroidia bacterium]
MYEHHKKPLLPVKRFVGRLLNNLLIAFILIALALLIGILGYHFVCGLAWIDSLLNASMILAGMGPVDIIQTNAGKLFASFYAVFSGVAFLSIIAVILAPVVHRFLHKFHLRDGDENDTKK